MVITMKTSLKHLFRTPIKTLLFFLLMTACTLLLVFGSVMLAESSRRITAAADAFQTVGTIRQPPVSTRTEITPDACLGRIARSYDTYGETISVDALHFEGAEYMVPPENRPYYIAHLPQLRPTRPFSFGMHIVEFTALEDCDSQTPIQAEITKVLFTNAGDDAVPGVESKPLQVGDVIHFCQCGKTQPAPLKAGTTYVASIMVYPCETHGVTEYRLAIGPHSTQCGPDGAALPDHWFPQGSVKYLPEVTEDFYDEGQHGQDWLQWAEFRKTHEEYYGVLPTNSLKLLPSYHEGLLYVEEGREISEEEFETGAPVCMIPQSMATTNRLSVGDTLTLPLLCSLYGLTEDDVMSTNIGYNPSQWPLFDRNGDVYQPFWEAEYEIVGTYKLVNEGGFGAGEIAYDMPVIPAKSVKASDENNIAHVLPMNSTVASFQIPNGSIEEFDKALREAVPEAEQLVITYDDMGYAKVMKTLQAARNMAILLCAVGTLAAVAIVVLLLYFFIVRQKKRTAIERSLGMSRRQCRTSLIAGILALTVAAAVVGSVGGALLLEYAQPVPAGEEAVDTGGFDTSYSLWAKKQNAQEELLTEQETPAAAYLAAPLAQLALVLILSLLLAQRNLKSKPILLLSAREE